MWSALSCFVVVLLLDPIVAYRTTCSPGSSWIDDDGCSRCTCLDTSEPMCTECAPQPNENTRTCHGGHSHCSTCSGGHSDCPVDCRRKFEPERKCFSCHCRVGEIGDTVVSIRQLCPPGMDVREQRGKMKACAPYDRLPSGDTKLCGTNPTCPTGCDLVRRGHYEGCVYCQCSLQMRAGDIVVPAGLQCPRGFLVRDWEPKRVSCKPPTPHACSPGTKFEYECNTCICLEPGTIAACTRRICDTQSDEIRICDGPANCPADCGRTLNTTGNCYECKCDIGEEGDTIVPIDQPCPRGTTLRQVGWATKACKPFENATLCTHGTFFKKDCNVCVCLHGDNRHCTQTDCSKKEEDEIRTCDGQADCPADCGRTLNTTGNCYECKCDIGEEGDTIVPIDQPCPRGTTLRQNGWATKACKPFENAATCTPGAIFKEDCNVCLCSHDGNHLCSKTDCSKNVEVKRCIPGTSFEDDCNSCYCSKAGWPFCTYLLCN